jgi:hypothetical protein
VTIVVINNGLMTQRCDDFDSKTSVASENVVALRVAEFSATLRSDKKARI